MSLIAPNIHAFLATARSLNFTRAAKSIHITQSALSQRIGALEIELKTSLFVRDRAGIRLTSAGEKLLRHCQTLESIDAAARREIADSTDRQTSSKLNGSIRLGGFSSVIWSIILPSISKISIDNPDIDIEFFSRENRDLPRMLRSAEIEFVVGNSELKIQGIENLLLGHEENILVEKQKISHADRIFLDHDPDDETTLNFLTKNRLPTKSIRRFYLDDIHGIVAGVKQGIGSAVIPVHLQEKTKGLYRDSQLRSLDTPVYLSFYAQPYFTQLHHVTVDAIRSHCKSALKQIRI